MVDRRLAPTPLLPKYWLSFTLLVACVAAARGAADHPIANLTNCSLHEGLTISLFASEPEVVDPVALTFDAAGRAYVVEMRDYPYGFGPDRKPGGTVRLLQDTNHDGRVDKSTLFAENLSFPTSICAWNGGILVTCPPEIIFLRDTDGDGKADVREVIYKGFTLGVTDSNVNGLRWGLDNRVHGLNGGNGGMITSLKKADSPAIPLFDLDFSFDPASGDFRTTFHSSRGFGIVFDDWGRSFVTYNINHIQQRFIPQRYLRRFPGFPPLRATGSISDHGDMARIYPVSIPETRPNHPEQSGYFSAAGGMGYVGWDRFGTNLYGSVLVCDVVGNLVHRDVPIEDGAIFRARRAIGEEKSEFFASHDNAFRPVGLEQGPDGALYLLDMQRDVIEHPDYIPEKIRAKLDLRAGEDRGRIYRIAPIGVKNEPVDLESTPNQVLVENLSHEIPWRRWTAQRLLVQRHATDVIQLLQRVALSGERPLGRLHALWTLEGVKALEVRLIERALSDPNPGIRENAVLLAEPFLTQSKELSERIVAMANDHSPHVRFQAALTLGMVDLPGVQEALRSILFRDYDQRWSRVAVLCSLRSGVADILGTWIPGGATNSSATQLISEVSDLAVTRDGPQGFLEMLRLVRDRHWGSPFQLAALKGLQIGLGRRGITLSNQSEELGILDQFARSESVAVAAASWRVARMVGSAETEAQHMLLESVLNRVNNTGRSEEARTADIGLLALGGYSKVGNVLFGFLTGSETVSIQQAALGALREFNDPAIAKNLVERWRTLAPGVRPGALALLLSRQSFHDPLLTALESGRITVGELNLDLEQRRRLLWHSAPEIQARAAKLIGDGEYSNRKSIVEEWLEKLPKAGDAVKGRAVFEQRCAQCHLVGTIGHRVGPELTGMSHRSVEDLLSNILDPNMAINPAYIAYNCEMTSGDVETGLLHADSPEAITLLQAGEKKVVIPRSNIKQLQSSSMSLMPEGLEAGLMPVDLRDLIAFLQESKGE